MSNPALQPRHTEPVVDPRTGIVTKAWADYFLRLSTQQSSDDLAQLYKQLAVRVSELEDGGALGFQIFGQDSIILNGSTQPGAVLVITLQGDQESPADTSYYGTGPDGVKGWHPVSGAIQVVADDLTKDVDADGVTTFGLADVADAGTGTLQKTQFDGKGRKTGTAAATTDDLPQGAINKYFPEAPTDGWPYARQSLGWAPLDGPLSPYYLLKFPALTDQAGNVLTDQQGRVLLGNTPAIPYSWLSGVPANLQSVAALAGEGLTYRTAGGAWSQVTLASLRTLPSMDLAAANALTGVADFQMVAITDLAGGREPCWYDATVASGTKWRRFSDRSIAN